MAEAAGSATGIKWDREGALGWIVRARREKSNAIEPSMLAGIESALKAAEVDPEVKVQGPAFSGRFDLASDGTAVSSATASDSVSEFVRLRQKISKSPSVSETFRSPSLRLCTDTASPAHQC